MNGLCPDSNRLSIHLINQPKSAGRFVSQGVPGQAGMSMTVLYPTPAQACGISTGLVLNPASGCSTFFDCSAAMGPRLQACPNGSAVGTDSTSCTAAPECDCPLSQPLPFAQGEQLCAQRTSLASFMKSYSLQNRRLSVTLIQDASQLLVLCLWLFWPQKHVHWRARLYIS